MTEIALTLNGVPLTIEIALGDTLLTALRAAGMKSVKDGCAHGDCGACAVLVDGRAMNACLMLAVQANGHEVVTLEGLAGDVLLHPLQEAALDAGGVQCGYCTPGMLLAAADLLARNPEPSDEEVRDAIGMNLCRCTGYVKQIDGIHAAASGEVAP